MKQSNVLNVVEQIVAAAAPAFQPRNRSGRGDLGKVAFEVDGRPWYVDDINHDDSPAAWATPGLSYWVSRTFTRGREAFVVVKHGNYLKWPPARGQYKGRTRYFPSARLAAKHAMELPE